MISLAMLSGCTAASHPSVLAAAAPGSAVAAAVSAPNSPSASVAASPQSSALPGAAATTSTSIAGTPTSAADASPTALSSNDIATGVRATAQTFFDDLNIALATGDVRAYDALTSPYCSCRSIAKTIAQTYSQHQHFVGAATTVTSIDVVSFVAIGASADVHYTISPGRVLDAQGNQVNTSLAQPNGRSLMFVTSTDGRWLVAQNTLLHQGSP
jgi:hypothetical protein